MCVGGGDNKIQRPIYISPCTLVSAVFHKCGIMRHYTILLQSTITLNSWPKYQLI